MRAKTVRPGQTFVKRIVFELGFGKTANRIFGLPTGRLGEAQFARATAFFGRQEGASYRPRPGPSRPPVLDSECVADGRLIGTGWHQVRAAEGGQEIIKSDLVGQIRHG